MNATLWMQQYGCSILDETFECNILDAKYWMQQFECTNLNATFGLLAMCVVSMTT